MSTSAPCVEPVVRQPGPPLGARAEGAVRVRFLRDGDRDAWENYVRNHPQATLFHALGWGDAVVQAFGHEPYSLLAERGGGIVGLLPLFLVRSRLAGRLLVSVPYGVGGGSIADDVEATIALFDRARSLADEHACKGIDLRSATANVPGLPTNERYLGFERELPNNVDEVLSWLPRKARAAARNARHKHGLAIRFGDEYVDDVWTLYARSMRCLGSINYPLRFFRALLDRTPGRHWVSLALWRNRPVGGLVTFLWRDRVMPYFVGTAATARRCNAANYLYFAVMELAVQRGFRICEVGRSRRDNAGCCDFKRFHGFQSRPLGYQQYVSGGGSLHSLTPDNGNLVLARRVWSFLPLWITRPLGARLARHIPG